ncbi:NmrA family protein [Rhodopseudomonas boonkerdii]|uniref:NmrA family NAD(P)-binding protein n=1 Tax=Rhodopseudomonas boonkerdii TaxID=475937 RepID=UPI001E41B0AD|nr:NmrA family NAD(P)-binding protein [Rhodopseudomonas boonkerdii]UGV28455.1 NmrA family protein [Rhodopseudomonas boonkerdii]
MSQLSRIFVIGATGAQGIPVVRGLVGDGRYSVLALTRDSSSARAKSLATMGDVNFLEGTFADEAILRQGMQACDGVFMNLDGFNAGEKTEMYWAIRAYEIALEERIKFFVYGNLDYTLKKAGYNSAFRTGHYDGKGRIGEWILSQSRSGSSDMGAALFTSGPYIEMAFSGGTPMTPRMEDGVLTWRVPLGDGAVVHVALEDCAYYVRWLFDNPERSNGMDLEVAIEHVRYADLAAAFERVTGCPARYVDTDITAYFAPMQAIAAQPAGYNADPTDKSTMSFQENFTGFWNQWKHNIITRDYALLDRIHPNRIRSAEDWMRREERRAKESGSETLWERVQPGTITQRRILKLSEDQRRGAL